jgi:hypothetical protein
MATYMKCKVSRGQFSDEFSIRGISHDGVEFSLFAWGGDVIRSTTEEGEHDGWILVEVKAREANRTMVKLPGLKFDARGGQIVTVFETELEERGPQQ